MSTQLAPFAAQRRHWYAYVIGVVPFHVPDDAVSVEPSVVVPEIVGTDLVAGFQGYFDWIDQVTQNPDPQ